ncbi:hypothetical protein LOD99_14049 [Oopsacas minuta]|uniref:Uncharacterized protein n=1 Tax=Oopsacas minuta TaxID=111878 RepID=A0AAV7KH81_9METZ|nr:hypothetical protein LOD99_14049 [Oopsacas minuta]
MIVEQGITKLTNLVKEILTNKIAELKQYEKDFDEFAMGNQIGEYLAEKFSMGLSELLDSKIELRDSIRSYILSADTDRDYTIIINQLEHHNSVVTLQELVRVLEIERDMDDINRQKIEELIGSLRTNKGCVLNHIREQIESTNESNNVGKFIERLAVFLGAIRVVASPREFTYVIRNLGEILEHYKVRKFCIDIWFANIGCRTCNDTTGRPITHACNGLCSTTVWVCLAPLVRAISRADDVITYKRILAEETETQSDSMILPSVDSIADELESLTREAIQRINTDDLVSILPRIARACAFDADIADTETAVDIRGILNDRINDFSNKDITSVPTVSTMTPTRVTIDQDTKTNTERDLQPTMPSTPEDTMAPPPGDTMAPPPGDTMAPPPGDTMAPPPGDTMAPPPGDTMAPPPGDTMAPPPGDTMAPPPGDTMAPPPGDTMAPPPEDTMVPPPGDTMAPPPEDTMAPPPGDTMAPPPGDTMDPDNGGRRRREVTPISIPLPPDNLLPSIIQIISKICTAEYSTITNNRCWNGTHVDTFIYNIDYSREVDEMAFQAVGIEFNQEKYLAETSAISGGTNPCEGIQGESEVYYNVISNSSAVCLQEGFGNRSIGLTANLCLLVIAISFMLLQAFYI